MSKLKLKTEAELTKAVKAAEVSFYRSAYGHMYGKIPRTNSDLWDLIRTGCSSLDDIKGRIRCLLANKNVHNFNSGTLHNAISNLVHETLNSEPSQVFIRVAARGESLFLDLANKTHEVVEITAKKWQVIPNPSDLLFYRPDNTQPLPTPTRNGKLEPLQTLFNLEDSQWPLLLGYILSILNPRGPQLLALVEGEAGSGKSSFCRLIRRLIDPRCPELVQLPPDGKDVLVGAFSSWLLAFDNVSRPTRKEANVLCGLSTETGQIVRQMYSNHNSTGIQVKAPVLINGIAGLTKFDDLLSRAVVFTLSGLSNQNRKTENEIKKVFDEGHSGFLGKLLDLAVGGLKKEVEVPADGLGRMADAAEWVESCLQAADYPMGTFTRAVQNSHKTVAKKDLDSWPLWEHLSEIVQEDIFEGSSSDLLLLLESKGIKQMIPASEWPTSTNLGTLLSQHAEEISRRGYRIEKLPGRSDGRKWRISSKLSQGTDSETPNCRFPKVIKKYREFHRIDPDLNCLFQTDLGFIVCGKHAEAYASKLKRPVEPGPILIINETEFENFVFGDCGYAVIQAHNLVAADM